MGLLGDAAARFEEAERMQKETQRTEPPLYSLAGFRYCDLLLDQGRYAEVRARAARMLDRIPAWYSLLSIALDHLSFGRAHVFCPELSDEACTAALLLDHRHTFRHPPPRTP